MIWLFLTGSLLAVSLVKLGALSVWASVLASALFGSTALVIVLIALLIWQRRKS